ncbi:ROK family transcriptional regulator [Amnibacterium endophyticum]|uniref:ROK family protein n=1 Tax=Amnibacterium endophyticum TaxID=2109337 RepID=A0ABW4LC99_9MICO
MAKPDDVPILIRRTHEERILATLRESGPLTRAELERRIGLSRTTLSDITSVLLRRGAIVERRPEEGPRGRGRPAVRLALDPASGQFLGVDLGHRRVQVAVVNAANEVIASGERAYIPEMSWSERLEVVFGLIDDATAATGVRLGALEGIGFGVPGPLGSAFGDESRVPPRWQGTRRDKVVALIRERVAERFEAPLVLDNNTRFAALGEAVWGPSLDTDSLLYIRLSDGVGGGVVAGSRLVVGSLGTAGELGHITVDPRGARCWCGKQGCLETVASAPAIRARVAEGAAEKMVVREAGAATGRVLAAASTVMDPTEVVVAGEVLRYRGFLDAVRTAFEHEVLPTGVRTRLRASTLSEQAGALGAIAAAFHRSPLLVGYASWATSPVRVADRLPA